MKEVKVTSTVLSVRGTKISVWLIISPVYVYILGTSYFVTPLLGADVHARIEICVIENYGICIKHSSNSWAAVVGQDAAEHLLVPVKLLQTLLQGKNTIIDKPATYPFWCGSCGQEDWRRTKHFNIRQTEKYFTLAKVCSSKKLKPKSESNL